MKFLIILIIFNENLMKIFTFSSGTTKVGIIGGTETGDNSKEEVLLGLFSFDVTIDSALLCPLLTVSSDLLL